METKLLVGIVAVCLTLVGEILLVVSLAVPSWWEVTLEGYEFNIGLFKYCINIFGFKVCSSHSEISATFEAVRWLVLAGCVFGGIALFVGLVLLCLKKPGIAIAAGVLAVFAGVLVLAGISIFAYESHDNDMTGNYSFCFVLAIIGMILLIVAGGLFFYARPPKEQSSGRVVNDPNYPNYANYPNNPNNPNNYPPPKNLYM